MASAANENITPKVYKSVLMQLSRLPEQLEGSGISYEFNEADPMDIQVSVIGPEQTPYEGGLFRIKLALPSDFPLSPPKAFVLTKIFHPNISDKGEVCVNTLKRDWDPSKWSLAQILLTIRCLLIVPFPESALNEKAGRLFMESYDEYAAHARMMTSVHAIGISPGATPATTPLASPLSAAFPSPVGSQLSEAVSAGDAGKKKITKAAKSSAKALKRL